MSPPIRWARMARAASRETRNDPRAITSCCTSQSAAVVSSSGLEIDSPALFTTRSTPPKASAAAATAAATCSSSVTSAVSADGGVGAADLVGDGGGAVRVAVGDHDARALGGQPERDGPADAASPPR